jgi:hypothetical protein
MVLGMSCLLATWLSCLGGGAPEAPPAGHLYVAFGNGALVTYALMDGLPAEKPDLTYGHFDVHNFPAALTLGDRGDLYAIDQTSPRVRKTSVRRYGPHSTRLIGSARLPTSHRRGETVTPLDGLAVDKQGYTFVSYYKRYISGVGFDGGITSGFDIPNFGIFVIDPQGRTVRAMRLPWVAWTLAVDSGGALYVQIDSSIRIYEDPVRDPSHYERLVLPQGCDHSDEPMPLVVRDEIYASVGLEACGGTSFVAVYPLSARGDAKPSRMISSVGNFNGATLAVGDRYAYVDGYGSSVVVLDKRVGVPQQPVLTFASPSVHALRIGP